jgi:hypothetical protein
MLGGFLRSFIFRYKCNCSPRSSFILRIYTDATNPNVPTFLSNRDSSHRLKIMHRRRFEFLFGFSIIKEDE